MNIQLRRRLDLGTREGLIIRSGGAVSALILIGIILLFAGRNPFDLAQESLKATFTTRIGFENTLLIASPILMAAVAVAIGFRAKVWNIGVAGQFYMGAWGAALVGLHWEGPTILVLPVMAIAAAIAGGLWAFGPAVAKALLGVNEVVTTLLLNFVAVQWVVWWSTDMWRDPNLGTLSATPRIATEVPLIPGAITLHSGIIVPILLVVVFAVVFRNSIWGYEVDLTGGNPAAATFAGIPVARRIIAVLVTSGAIAGVSGMIQMTGAAPHRLSGTLENQYGISGFMVAALAGASFLALLGVGFFVAFLLHSGIVLSTQAGGITVNLVIAIYGAILLSVGVAEFATRYRLLIQRGEGPAPPPKPDAATAEAPS